MASAFRKFSKRRLSLTLSRNKAIESASDTRSDRGAFSSPRDSDSDCGSVVDSRGYDSDDDEDESIGMLPTYICQCKN